MIDDTALADLRDRLLAIDPVVACGAYEEVVSLLAEGGPAGKHALAAVFEATSRKVYSFVLLMTGSREAADDITTEVYLRLERRCQRRLVDVLPDRTNLDPLLLHIAKGEIRRHQLRNARRPVREVPLEAAPDPSVIADPAGPTDDDVEQRATRALACEVGWFRQASAHLPQPLVEFWVHAAVAFPSKPAPGEAGELAAQHGLDPDRFTQERVAVGRKIFQRMVAVQTARRHYPHPSAVDPCRELGALIEAKNAGAWDPDDLNGFTDAVYRAVTKHLQHCPQRCARTHAALRDAKDPAEFGIIWALPSLPVVPLVPQVLDRILDHHTDPDLAPVNVTQALTGPLPPAAAPSPTALVSPPPARTVAGLATRITRQAYLQLARWQTNGVAADGTGTSGAAPGRAAAALLVAVTTIAPALFLGASAPAQATTLPDHVLAAPPPPSVGALPSQPTTPTVRPSTLMVATPPAPSPPESAPPATTRQPTARTTAPGGSPPPVHPSSPPAPLPDLTGGMSLVFTKTNWPTGTTTWAINLKPGTPAQCPGAGACYVGATPWYAAPTGIPQGQHFVLTITRTAVGLEVNATDGLGATPTQHYHGTDTGHLSFTGTFTEDGTGRVADMVLASCTTNPGAPMCDKLPA